MKKVVLALAAILAVSVWSAPAFAAKALSDDDLDQLTAAGEPKVLWAHGTDGGGGIAIATDDAVFNLDIPTDSQKGLRALTVANVVGEAQLLVNLNVASVANQLAGTDQRNFSVQSWGSTLAIPEAVATVDGVPGIDQRGNPNCTSSCTSSEQKKANGNIGVVAAPGAIEIGVASADVIMRADGLNAEVRLDEEPVYNLKFEPLAQVDLSALFIANVVGRVQAAYNINIAAATLNIVPSPDKAFAEPAGFSTGVIKQVNSGVQFRGTPIGVGNTLGVINVTHTPND